MDTSTDTRDPHAKACHATPWHGTACHTMARHATQRYVFAPLVAALMRPFDRAGSDPPAAPLGCVVVCCLAARCDALHSDAARCGAVRCGAVRCVYARARKPQARTRERACVCLSPRARVCICVCARTRVHEVCASMPRPKSGTAARQATSAHADASSMPYVAAMARLSTYSYGPYIVMARLPTSPTACLSCWYGRAGTLYYRSAKAVILSTGTSCWCGRADTQNNRLAQGVILSAGTSIPAQ